jgi:ribosome-associated protein
VDLRVRPGPGVPDGLVVPAGELVEQFARSSGPGGQGVNTTDSQVLLVWDVTGSPSLTDAQRRRVLRRLDGRLSEGRLLVVATAHRSQHRNRVTARERMADLVRDALAPPPPPRRPTRPGRSSQRRRLEAKKRRGETKALRGRVRDA